MERRIALVRYHKPIPCTRDMKPIYQLAVFSCFSLRIHHAVEFVNLGKRLVGTVCVLNVLVKKPPRLEGYNLIGAVLNNLIADFGAFRLFPMHNRLNPAIVIIKPLALVSVLRKRSYRFVENIYDILVRNLRYFRENRLPPVRQVHHRKSRRNIACSKRIVIHCHFL